jgi:hypothetical protein
MLQTTNSVTGKQPINLILMEQAQPYNENWMLVVS